MKRLRALVTMLLLIATAGCGGDDDGVVSSTTVEEAGTALPGPDEPWDVLFLGADYLYPTPLAEMYAARAADALGVEVRAQYPSGTGPINYTTVLLGHLRNEMSPRLGDLTRQAEIIVLFPRIDRTDKVGEVAVDTAHLETDFNRCQWDIAIEGLDGRPIGDRAGQPGVPPAFDDSPGYWAPYRESLNELYTEIWSLRQGLPTLLITIDMVNVWLPHQDEAGIGAECTIWWESWSAQHREAAAENGSAMVSIYDLLNGGNHDLDPGEMGYIGPTDDEPNLPWWRVNQTGLATIAEALVAVGFEPTAP